MPIETGSTISDLDPSWPLGGDSLLEGDNHLRLIKNVLRLQFPGASGQGFAKSIIATEDEINFLQGAASNIQDQINALEQGTSTGNLIAPPGTKMMFVQDTPPGGWEIDITYVDRMLRVRAAGGGNMGGTDDPFSFAFSHSHATTEHALTIAEMPQHRHTLFGEESSSSLDINANSTTAYKDPIGSSDEEYRLTQAPGGYSRGVSDYQGSGDTHSHGDTDTYESTFAPKYVDVIVGVKT